MKSPEVIPARHWPPLLPAPYKWIFRQASCVYARYGWRTQMLTVLPFISSPLLPLTSPTFRHSTRSAGWVSKNMRSILSGRVGGERVRNCRKLSQPHLPISSFWPQGNGVCKSYLENTFDAFFCGLFDLSPWMIWRVNTLRCATLICSWRAVQLVGNLKIMKFSFPTNMATTSN